MNNPNYQEEYKVFQEHNQLVLILNSEILLPENDPIRVTSAQLEELDYRKLYEAYSSRGRKSVNDLRVLFKVMTYGCQCGIFSTRKLEQAHRQRYEEVSTDAGYESLENYLYLESNGQMSFIKPANYEAQKTKKFRSQIGRIENMKYDENEDCYICAEGRKLCCRKVSTELSAGIPVTRDWYRCEDCRNCPQREKCCWKQDINAPKEIIRKETFWEKRKISQENITSERGILLRRNCSIQVEGAFGLLKNGFGFRRFLTTGKKNVRVELFFLALGFNLKKRWMKQEKAER